MMDPNRLPLSTMDARCLTWTGKTGVIEGSCLTVFRPSQVYRDACDVGFLLWSPRTGRELTVTHRRNVTDREGELVAQVYGDTEGLGIEVHILND